MSDDMTSSIPSECPCYVRCHFCFTILAVSVPCSQMFTTFKVGCGQCGNVLTVNMEPFLQVDNAPDGDADDQE